MADLVEETGIRLARSLSSNSGSIGSPRRSRPVPFALLERAIDQLAYHS